MESKGAHGFLAAMDGCDIPFRAWGEPTAAALVLLHGGGPYSRWYEALGKALAAREVGLLAYDQRGFGETAGPRGFATRFGSYLDDCGLAIAAAAARWPAAKVSLCGHSFGGLVALRYCLDRAGKGGLEPATLVLMAPWIRDTLRAPTLTVASALVNALFAPTVTYQVPLSVYDTADPSNRAVLSECQADRLWVHRLSARWFFGTRAAKLGILRRVRGLRLPVLQLEGTNDTLIDRDTNRRLFAAIGSPEKRLIVLRGVYHDMQLQSDIERIAEPVARFVRQGAAAVA
ncbi:MAG: lysophospholipase [Candidatus Eremiobacteraeota bacterium]|nr:lysophospholipase [Candidatus Eremiobacteraeota bacterium]